MPNSGDLTNGIRQAGEGVSKYLMENKGVLFAPRFGITYDLTGNQSLIVRGGGGVFYDRFQGNETFDMITNPPTTLAPTLNFGRLQDLGPASSALLAPFGLNAFLFEGDIPTVYNYNVGIQMKLPASFVLDVSYVGSQSRKLLQRRNINAVPYGAAFLPQNQDPTLSASATPGATSLPADFLRPYRGYGNINLHEMGGDANYNALQTTLDRRFTGGLLFGVSYTWSKALGTTNGADNDFHRIDEFDRQANYGPLNVDRRHNFSANFVYEIPRLSPKLGDNRVVRVLLDDWQLSGIYRAVSGQPYTPGYTIGGINNQNLTGSFTEAARLGVNGDAGHGTSSDPYAQLNAAAFTPPRPGSRGLESGRNWLVGPGINNFDLSIQKLVRLPGNVRFELRADAFNVFNHTQFGQLGNAGVNATANYTNLSSTVPSNLPYDAAGNFVFANRNGFGTVNAARDPRIIQLVARLRF